MVDPYACFFTVFTPTYNRAHTIERTYRSLMAQTDRDFEWLVVDDGSTDGTEELVAGWLQASPFPIRYFRLSHAGKHIAHNFAVGEARGQFTISLDSDDELKPDALEIFRTLWTDVPEAERRRFSGICCLAEDQHGNLVGNLFPASPLDTTELMLRGRLKVTGDKLFCRRTEVLREFLFPDVQLTYVPESFIALRMDRRYMVRYVNLIVLRYWVAHGLGQITSSTNFDWLAPGRALFSKVALHEQAGHFGTAPRYVFNFALNYVRYSLHARTSVWRQRGVAKSALAATLWLAAIPGGIYLWRRDLYRNSKRSA